MTTAAYYLVNNANMWSIDWGTVSVVRILITNFPSLITDLLLVCQEDLKECFTMIEESKTFHFSSNSAGLQS